jgi:hypothetical protein
MDYHHEAHGGSPPGSTGFATDHVVLMCIIDDAHQTNGNWPVLRDALLPMLLQSIRSAHKDACVCCLPDSLQLEKCI